MPDADEHIERSIAQKLEAAQHEAALIPARLLFQSPVSSHAIRASLSKTIVASYVLFLIGVGLFAISGSEHASPEKLHILSDIGKGLFLPIVTFVIGYAFGKWG